MKSKTPLMKAAYFSKRGDPLSDILTAPILEKMRRSQPRLRSLTLPRFGHAAQIIDAPEAVAAVTAFLDEQEQAS